MGRRPCDGDSTRIRRVDTGRPTPDPVGVATPFAPEPGARPASPRTRRDAYQPSALRKRGSSSVAIA